MKIQGNLIVIKGEEKKWSKVTEVSGYVDVQEGARFTAPALTKSGYVDVRQGARFTAPALTKSGYVDVHQGARFTAPALTKSGCVDVRQGARFTAPALTKSGCVDVRQGARFTAPALTEVSGYVDVRQEARFTAPALTEVSGSVYVQEGARFTAPALTKSGCVDVRQGARFTAPALTKSGYVDVRQGARFTAPALTKSGYVYVQEGARFTAPALTEVSGSVYVQEGARFTAPALKSTLEHLIVKGIKYKHSYYDGMNFYIEKSKFSKGIEIISGIYNIQIIDNKVVFKNGFIAKKDNHSSHAETVKKAISDLNFKLQSEKLKNEPIYLETILSENHFRLITGACELGVKNWKEQNNVKVDKIKVSELLPLLEKTNAYGLQKLKSLIKK